MSDELTEVWRTEFEKGYSGDTDSFVRHPAYQKTYWFEKVQLHWEGFLMAKRSQTVVELPKKNFVTNSYYCDDLHDSLNDAGIQYKVKD